MPLRGKHCLPIASLCAAWLAGCGAPAPPPAAAPAAAVRQPAAGGDVAAAHPQAVGDQPAGGLDKAAGGLRDQATGGLRDISFDDVKLDMQKGDPFTRAVLPSRVTALENTRVRIRGYILPSFQQTGLTQFVLVRDNMECCFGPGAALHDCVVVRMLPGKTAAFSIRPVAVTGRFRVEELRGPDGRHLAIYSMDGEQVQ